MLNDITASDSYLMINKRAIQIFGLTEAAYLSVILNIGKTVVRKKKVDSQGYFTVNRKFIESEIALSNEDQLTIDKAFSEAGILETCPDDVNKIRIDSLKVVEIITSDDAKVIKLATEKTKIKKTQKAASKKECILDMLKKSISETDLELRVALENLVEVLYEKGVTKKVQIQLLEEKINSYALSKSERLYLIQQMTMNGWKDPDWIIQKDSTLRKAHRNNNNIVGGETASKVATKDTVNQIDYF